SREWCSRDPARQDRVESGRAARTSLGRRLAAAVERTRRGARAAACLTAATASFGRRPLFVRTTTPPGWPTVSARASAVHRRRERQPPPRAPATRRRRRAPFRH